MLYILHANAYALKNNNNNNITHSKQSGLKFFLTALR